MRPIKEQGKFLLFVQNVVGILININDDGKMGIKFCPRCKSRDIIMIAGGGIGMYECKKCGYMGSLIPEIEIKKKSKNKLKKETRRKKK